MSRFELMVSLIVSLFIVNVIDAQVPSLDPSQTVNVATGEMGFNLPLGTVSGVNGTSFPVSVSYKAGISYNQEASAVGLGFGYGAGGITRKVVFVPDDCNGRPENYHKGISENCRRAWWSYLLDAAKIILAIVLAYLSIYTSGISLVAAIGLITTLVMSSIDTINLINYDPDDYIGGGTHLQTYDPAHNGKGYFKENGYNNDKPDMYFVNTPFISGELVWCGDYNPKQGKNGYFVFKTIEGGAEKNKRAVKVDYDVDEEKFVITLADGTMLFFEDTQRGGTYFTKSFWQASPGLGVDCHSDVTEKFAQNVPEAWLLTKIIYPDYVDNGGDLDPETNPENATGSWIVFGYKHTLPVKARQLPKNIQGSSDVTVLSTSGYDPQDTNASVYEEVQLEWVRTPNQSAQYFYSPERLDNLWFISDKMEWPEFARGSARAKNVKRKTTATDPLFVKNLRLDSILIYSKEVDTLRRIRFNTDYSLKPGSFNSYSKDVNGRFVTVAGNPNAACLTLKKIEVSDRDNSQKYNVFFNYIEKNVNVWDSTQTRRLPGPDAAEFYIERKDYWGNFYLNTENYNDFNQDGFFYKTEQAAYWSINKVELPNGINISWDYESNRYDAANNQVVQSSGPNKTKYGCGIRVRKMTIDNGINKPLERSYFYTDVAGNFCETDENSSGHATIEPFPYIADRLNERSSELIDRRPEMARGGYYTPAKVTYEMVQVADNFDNSINAKCNVPNGFTVYEFITPKDDSPAETFVNEGGYGEIDNSWKRGILKSKSIYNHNKQVISSEKYFYEFIEQNKKIDFGIFNMLDSNQNCLYEHRCGWVKPVKTETTKYGVTTTVYNKYATDLTPRNTPDYLCFSKKEIESFTASSSIGGYAEIDENSRTLVCRTKYLDGTGPDSAYDYLLLRTYVNSPVLDVAALSNVNEDPGNISQGNWTDGYSTITMGLPLPDIYVIGASLFNVDNNDKPDLIVLARDHETLLDPYMYVFVCHDVKVGSNNKVSWSRLSVTLVTVNNDDLQYLKRCSSDPSTGWDAHPDGSMICNFYGDPNKPDILIFTGPAEAQHFPGDIISQFSDSDIPPYGRSIFAFTDFVESSLPPSSPISSLKMEMKLWRRGSGNPYLIFGDHAVLKAVDNDSIKNDLVVTGPGCNNTFGIFGDSLSRPVYSQVFKNMQLENSNVSFDSCINCQDDSGKILFNLKPQGGKMWRSTRFAGYYEDPDDPTDPLDTNIARKFVFFSDFAGKPSKFQILKYHPVYYIGDYDGMPNRTYTLNSDSSVLLNSVIPAYWKYKGMDSTISGHKFHMLTQKCGSVSLKFPAGSLENVLCGELFTNANNRKILSAGATVWKQTNGTGNPYLPIANYAWNDNLDSSGAPVSDFVMFNYQTGVADSCWRLTDSVCKYTKSCQTNETAKPVTDKKRLLTSTVYGHKGILPVATIGNANFEECGVFTCDYNDNQDGYFDKDNGWEIGNSTNTVYPNPPHIVELCNNNVFGTKSVKVQNAWGPTRNCRLSFGRNYVMTAMVKVENGNAWMACDFRYKSKSTSNIWPVSVSDLIKDDSAGLQYCRIGPTGGKWVLMKMDIPASTILKLKDWNSRNWYARAYVGSVTGGDVYVQDIRFIPSDAMATSTYYDTLLQLPILSVNANSQPDLITAYDGYGRPVRWSKIDLSKASGSSGFLTTVKEKKYTSVNEGIFIRTPVTGSVYTPGQEISIQWRNERDRNVSIYYSSNNSDSWILLADVSYDNGKREYSYTWTIPSDILISQLYGIKIVDSDSPDKVFDQTGYFSIVNAKIVYPSENDILYTGMFSEIRYLIVGGTSVPVTISVNGVPIAATNNTGSYSWLVPFDSPATDNLKIKISGTGFSAENKGINVHKRSFFKRNVFDLNNPKK